MNTQDILNALDFIRENCGQLADQTEGHPHLHQIRFILADVNALTWKINENIEKIQNLSK